MNSRTIFALGAALVLALGACAGSESAREEAADAATAGMEAAEMEADEIAADAMQMAPAWVSQVANMANAIEATPAAADSILKANNMRRAAFDSLLYVIAGDAMLTDQYEALRTK